MGSSMKGLRTLLQNVQCKKQNPFLGTQSASLFIRAGLKRSLFHIIQSPPCSTCVEQRSSSFVGRHSSFHSSSSSSLLSSNQTQTQTQTRTKENADPVEIAREDLQSLFKDIRRTLSTRRATREMATYHFDGRGKSLRPLMNILVAKAVNFHMHSSNTLLPSQFEIAKITEMIHVASLLHDDVIDGSDIRRGKPAVQSVYGDKNAVMAGDFVLSVAATMLAKLRHEEVVCVLSQVLIDLVQGEFMQLGSKENENERFKHYLSKTFNKTASLIAFSCKAVALLSGADESVQKVAFEYGKNCGIAFQLVDDMLDFTSTVNNLGKPNFNDLRSGMATAPVLFACEKFPELNPMIMRRFDEPNDLKKALQFVKESDGIEQTRFLAQKHCQEAVRQIRTLKSSQEQNSLCLITDDIVNRIK